MSRKDSRLDGKYPLAYTGVHPRSVPLFFSNDRGPTVNDKEFYIGTLWLNRDNLDLWMLADLSGGVALWIRFATLSNGVIDFITDAGTANAAASILNVIGDGVTDTTGLLNTLTTDLVNGADGELYIGDGALMASAVITSAGGSITITNGPNTINLEDPGTGAINQIDGDAGSALPILSNVQLLGGVNFATTAIGDSVSATLSTTPTLTGTLTLSLLGAGVMQTDAAGEVTSDNGADGEVLIGGGAAPAWENIISSDLTVTITNGVNTINLEANLFGITDIDGDTGTAVPVGGNVKVLGGTNITTVGAGNDLTINLDNSIVLAGTLTLDLLGVGVMQTDATGLVTSDNGANGQMLIGGGAAPAWANFTSPGGSIVITNGPNTINLEAPDVIPTDTVFNVIHSAADPLNPLPLGYTDQISLDYGTSHTLFDPGANVVNSHYVCPRTGKYNLQAAFRFYSTVAVGDTRFTMTLVTSNRTFEVINYDWLPNPGWAVMNEAQTLDFCCDLDIGDTAELFFIVDVLAIIPKPPDQYRNTVALDEATPAYDEVPTFLSGFYIGE